MAFILIKHLDKDLSYHTQPGSCRDRVGPTTPRRPHLPPGLPGPQDGASQWGPGLHWIFPDITSQNPGQGPSF